MQKNMAVSVSLGGRQQIVHSRAARVQEHRGGRYRRCQGRKHPGQRCLFLLALRPTPLELLPGWGFFLCRTGPTKKKGDVFSGEQGDIYPYIPQKHRKNRGYFTARFMRYPTQGAATSIHKNTTRPSRCPTGPITSW